MGIRWLIFFVALFVQQISYYGFDGTESLHLRMLTDDGRHFSVHYAFPVPGCQVEGQQRDSFHVVSVQDVGDDVASGMHEGYAVFLIFPESPASEK